MSIPEIIFVHIMGAHMIVGIILTVSTLQQEESERPNWIAYLIFLLPPSMLIVLTTAMIAALIGRTEGWVSRYMYKILKLKPKS